jgi:hypothetical protein
MLLRTLLIGYLISVYIAACLHDWSAKFGLDWRIVASRELCGAEISIGFL